MKKIDIVIIDRIGFHARPASLIVNVASNFESDIKIIDKNGNEANLKSIINIMSLPIIYGEQATIIAEGIDENEAIKAIEESLKKYSLI